MAVELFESPVEEDSCHANSHSFLSTCTNVGHVTRVIEILGSYSLSLKELRDILSYLYTGQMKTWVSLLYL